MQQISQINTFFINQLREESIHTQQVPQKPNIVKTLSNQKHKIFYYYFFSVFTVCCFQQLIIRKSIFTSQFLRLLVFNNQSEENLKNKVSKNKPTVHTRPLLQFGGV
eukprot:TRINITY_DN3152_c1_g1_i1.p5 TRINITY_DN3152_c1_g1~~TRINITY_DN3152_c1_g1_i1.p5  ORF type:complete len:107 (+),score=4.19 TRINITY_DN3152_c1_g1_i1:128-448(+)